ncbi:C1 family peptidase [Fodinicola feengrottensis]|nr:C1 family peptidase [Fodinicola feengrottensis]
MEQDQGIDTKADYPQGDFDYTTQPTAAQRQNAAHYRISSYSTLPLDGTLQQAIESAVVQGQAVVVAFRVRQSFDYVTADDDVYSPGGDGTDPVTGGHTVVVIGYDANGFKFENSWGTGWGANGFATAPWSFVSSADVDSVYVLHNLIH